MHRSQSGDPIRTPSPEWRPGLTVDRVGGPIPAHAFNVIGRASCSFAATTRECTQRPGERAGGFDKVWFVQVESTREGLYERTFGDPDGRGIS